MLCTNEPREVQFVCHCHWDVVNIIIIIYDRGRRGDYRVYRLSPIKIVNWHNGGARWRLSNQPRRDGRRLWFNAPDMYTILYSPQLYIQYSILLLVDLIVVIRYYSNNNNNIYIHYNAILYCTLMYVYIYTRSIQTSPAFAVCEETILISTRTIIITFLYTAGRRK